MTIITGNISGSDPDIVLIWALCVGGGGGGGGSRGRDLNFGEGQGGR